MTSSNAARREPSVSSISRVRVSTVSKGFGCAVERIVDPRALGRNREDDILAGACEAVLRIVGLTGESGGELFAACFVGGLEFVDLRAR